MQLTRTLFGFFIAFCFQATALASILPPNSLHLQKKGRFNPNMTEERFNQVIDQVVQVYKPIIASQGAKLTVLRYWTDETVNAFATKRGPNEWVIMMYGGLARRSEITDDGFALVACHELGHHLGGFPFYTNQTLASEGQSDFFATQSCLRKVWATDLEKNASFREKVDPVAKEKCDRVWTKEYQQNLCYRVTDAGRSVANLFASMDNGNPRFATPDSRVVVETQLSHPNSQCRLDTYVAGGLCKAAFPTKFVPGQNDPDGTDSYRAEAVASLYTCSSARGYTVGQRPKCWFKQSVDYLGLVPTKTIVADQNKNQVVEPGERIDIRQELANWGREKSSDVTITATAMTPGVTITGQNTASYGHLEPRASVAGQGFEMEVSKDVKCGTKVTTHLDAKAHNGRVLFLKNFMVGALRQLAHVHTESTTPILRNEYVTSPGEVDVKGTYVEARVTVDAEDEDLNSILLYIQAPEGKYHFLGTLDAGGTGLQKTKKSFVIPLENEAVSGTWTLWVKSDSSTSSNPGILKSWDIGFSRYVCDASKLGGSGAK